MIMVNTTNFDSKVATKRTRKILIIIELPRLSDRLSSTLEKLELEGYELKIGCFFQAMIEKIRQFISVESKIDYIQDLFSKDDLEAVDEEAYNIIRKWYLNESLRLPQKLSYRGINLGSLVEYDFSLLLPQLLKRVKLVKTLILNERPDRVIILSNKYTLARIMECLKKSLNLSFQLECPDFDDNEKSYVGLSEINIRNCFKFAAQWLIDQFDWVTHYLQKISRATRYDKHTILFRNPNYAIMDALNQAGFYTIILDEKMSRKGLLSKYPYYVLSNRINLSSWRRRKLIKNKLRALWSELKASSLFQSIFTFEDVCFWSLIEEEFANMFRRVFPDKIDLIDAIYRMMKLTKPSLIISIPGITPVERAIFRAAAKLAIPTLVIQHGLTGAKRTQQIVHSKYASVWGNAQKDWYAKFGNEKNRIFVTGNPNYDKLLAGNLNFMKIEYLCNELGLDSQKGIFVLATNVTTTIPPPFFSACRVEDEGEITFRAILRALEKFKDKQLVVKPHPSETKQLYLDTLQEFPHLRERVKVVKQIDLYSLLNECELLLTPGSTVALEAMILEKPVLIINLTKRDLSIPFAEYGAGLEISDETDLVPTIKLLLFDKNFWHKMRKGQENFIRDFVGEPDGKSCQKIIQAIKEIIAANVVQRD